MSNNELNFLVKAVIIEQRLLSWEVSVERPEKGHELI